MRCARYTDKNCTDFILRLIHIKIKKMNDNKKKTKKNA